MKTTINPISNSRVKIRFEDLITGDIVEYDIWAPDDGGYVRYNGDRQLCDRLSCRGNTLYWSGKAPLAELVRREYRAMRRSDKREARRNL
jgi:hypothetical protein